MGIVYAAEQEAPIRRRVALKVIKPGMDSRQVLARFESERQALAMMNHPNVAMVFDAGTTDEGRPYFVMEHVAGIAITEYCDKHALDNRRRLSLFMQVCAAIQHAHQKGIVHRDIKPSNILVSVQEGEAVPKVIDFGVAKAISQRLTEKTAFTEQGVLIGTPAYMSPEQAEMSGLDIDTRTDVYSLGVVLYELLVGALPFDPRVIRQAAFHEIQRIIRETEPPRPSARVVTMGGSASEAAKHRCTDPKSLRRQLRGDLDWITMRALEKDRTRRYGTASELAADIGRHLNAEPVAAGPPTAAYKLRKLLLRHKGAAAASIAVVASLAAGLAVSEWQRREAQHQRSIAEQEAYVGNLAAASAAMRLHDVRAARARLEACPVAKRGWEWRHLFFESDASVATLSGDTARNEAFRGVPRVLKLASNGTRILDQHAGWVFEWDASTHRPLDIVSRRDPIVAIDSAARRILTVREGTMSAAHLTILFFEKETLPNELTISMSSVESEHVLRTMTVEGEFLSAVAVDPGWTRLAVASFRDRGSEPPGERSGLVTVFDLATGRRLFTTDWRSEPVFRAMFSDDGRKLAVALKATVTVLESSTGRRLFERGEARPVTAVSFDARGRRLAMASEDGTARIWDQERTVVPVSLVGHDSAITSITFSPDGTLVATGSEDRTVRLWEAESGRMLSTLHGHEGWVESVTFEADGRRLLSGASDDTIRVWDLWRTPTWLFAPAKGHVASVAMSLDGGRVAIGYLDQPAEIRGTRSPAPPVLLNETESTSAIAFRPDGSTVATGHWDGSVRLWDAATGRSIATLIGHTSAVSSLAFSPDGGRLASTGDRMWHQGSGNIIDGTVRVWDVASRQPLLVYANHEAPVAAAMFLPLGDRIVSGAKESPAQLWDARTGRTLRTFGDPGTSSRRVALSADGRRLAVKDEIGRLRLYDTDSGALLSTLGRADDEISCVGVDRQAARIVAGSDDGRIQVWDTAATVMLADLDGLSEGIKGVRFSADSSQVVAHSSDEVIIWRSDSAYDPMALAAMERALENNVLVSEAVAAIRVDESLERGTAERASRMLDSRFDSPAFLDASSRRIALRPGANPEDYRRALRFAELAVARAAWSDLYQQTLGFAQYRNGMDAEALRSFHLENPGATGERSPNALVAAFSAMALARLGRRSESLRALGEFLEAQSAAPHLDLLTLAREVESVVLGPRSASARELVDRLFGELKVSDDVAGRLRLEPGLDPETREVALQLAKLRQDNPHALNGAAWDVVMTPGRTEEEYRSALRWASAACRLDPKHPDLNHTLGVAQYRVGNYEAALRSLEASEKGYVTARKRSQPANTVFIAMSLWRLGRREEARQTLSGLEREIVLPANAGDAEMLRFMDEARQLIGRRGTGPSAIH